MKVFWKILMAVALSAICVIVGIGCDYLMAYAGFLSREGLPIAISYATGLGVGSGLSFLIWSEPRR